MNPLLKGLREPHWTAIDVACTVLLAGVYGVEFNQPADLTGVPQGLAALIVAVAVLPAAARRRWPRTALALTVAGGAAVAALSFSPDPSLAAGFVMYLIPLRFARREALWLLGGSLLVTAAGDIAFGLARHGVYGPGGTQAAAGLLLESGLLLAGAWMIGYLVRLQRAYSAARAGRAAGPRAARRGPAGQQRGTAAHRARTARCSGAQHERDRGAGRGGQVRGWHTPGGGGPRAVLDRGDQAAARCTMRALLGVPGNLGAGPVPAPGLADLKTRADRPPKLTWTWTSTATVAAARRADLPPTG
jgi:hypothetical protein